MIKVTWFDYSKDKMFTEIINEDQLAWLHMQPHIEVDKIEEVKPAIYLRTNK